MARIKFSPVVASVGGSVGSATFQRSAQGFSLRVKPTGRKYRTQRQITRMSAMSQIQAAWQALDDDGRTLWDAFLSYSADWIKHDSSVLLSGHQLFIRYNAVRLMSGFSILTVPAFSPLTYVSPAISVDLTAGVLTLIGPDLDQAVSWLSVKLSPPVLDSVSNPRSRLRTIQFNLVDGTDHVITTPYIAAFGALPPDGSFLFSSSQLFSTVAPIVLSPYYSKVEVE